MSVRFPFSYGLDDERVLRLVRWRSPAKRSNIGHPRLVVNNRVKKSIGVPLLCEQQ
jgi:hypothetical protein